MNEKIVTGIKACVFDAYGTIFDYASAASRCRDVLGDKFESLNVQWREKQLQYTWLRASQNRHADFWQVTGDALDFAMERLELKNLALRARLMNLYLSLELFPECTEMLSALKARGMKTAILSNGTPAMLDAIVKAANIGGMLDAILSVEEVGVFKPHPDVYRLATSRLRLKASEILFCSSNAWDAYAASAFGMRVVWCNRYDQSPERLPGNPDRVVNSLADLPMILGLA